METVLISKTKEYCFVVVVPPTTNVMDASINNFQKHMCRSTNCTATILTRTQGILELTKDVQCESKFQAILAGCNSERSPWEKITHVTCILYHIYICYVQHILTNCTVSTNKMCELWYKIIKYTCKKCLCFISHKLPLFEWNRIGTMK